jgi:hypothetical protein
MGESANAAIVQFDFIGITKNCVVLPTCENAVPIGTNVTGSLFIDFGAEDGIGDSFTINDEFGGSSITLSNTLGTTYDIITGLQGNTSSSLGELNTLILQIDNAAGDRIQMGVLAGSGTLPGIGYQFDGAWTRVTAVPIPSAIWLFGSGVLGLIGISRRMKPV